MKASRSARVGKGVRTRSISWLLVIGVTSLVAFQVTISSQSPSISSQNPSTSASQTSFFNRAQAQDPGVRQGDAGAGAPLPGLTAQQNEYFLAGKADFDEAENMADGLGRA